MDEQPEAGPAQLVTNLVDRTGFRTLSDAERLRCLDVFDEHIAELHERALQLQASIAVAEWRVQVHDLLGGASA
jgi:hypothetical protein